jgi:dTDP-4-dehydrorhamnose reductase
VAEFCGNHSFQAVVHAGAVANPDQCEKDRELAWSVNVDGTKALVENLSPDTVLVYTSTDLVFDGSKGTYREGDDPSPPNYYAETKLEAEQWVGLRPNSGVIRIGKLYSNGSPFHPCFTTWMRERFERGLRVPLFKDQFRTPLWVGDAADAVKTFIRLGPRAGLYHLGGPERLSRLEFGEAFAEAFGYDATLIDAVMAAEAGLTQRGQDCSLDSSKFYREYDFSPCSLQRGLEQLKQESDEQG